MSYDNTIFQTAISDGMPQALANLIVAQSKHETNDYTSPIFQDCNNAFGYKAVRSSCLIHPDYQNYANIVDSTHEITAWIKRRLAESNFPNLSTITTASQYATLLQENGYFGDTLANYTAGLERWLGDHTKAAGLGVIVLAAFAFLFIKKKNKK